MEKDGLSDLLEAAFCKVNIRLRVYLEQHLNICMVQIKATADRLSYIRVYDTRFTQVGTGKCCANKLRIGSHGQINSRHGIGRDIHTVRNCDLTAQFANHTSHRGNRDIIDFALIRKAELIGKQDTIHPAVLERMQLPSGNVDHILESTFFVKQRISWQGTQMKQRDYRLLHSKQVFSPHIFHLHFSFCGFPTQFVLFVFNTIYLSLWDVNTGPPL